MSIKHKSFFLFLIIFSFVHLVFNFNLFRELAETDQNKLYVSDGTITEFIAEVGYQKIKAGENPFSYTDQVLYPFGINYSMNDPGISNSIFFIILRPLLSAHQSLLLIVLSNIFLAGILMYLFLVKLSKDTSVSALFAMIYTFMPFISHRLLGHYTYTPIYIFPLLGLVVWYFLQERSVKNKYWISIFTGAIISFSLYSNFYYFILVWMSLGFFIVWSAIKNFKNTASFILENFKFILLAGVVFIITLLPWLMELKNYYLFQGRNTLDTLGSAVHYSSDLLGFLIPNNYNLIYNWFLTSLTSTFPQFERLFIFYSRSWEKLVYPGIILLSSYAFILFRYKKLQKTKVWSKIAPFLVASLFFGIFLLGPFLKIAGKWSLDLDGVQLVFPLPFLIFNYLPILNSLRAPTRFMPIVIFYASIVGAHLMVYLLKNKLWRDKLLIFTSVFTVFFIDQFYLLPSKISSPVETELYNEIKKDKTNFRVLEIPFTVRDGFNYLGFVHALAPMQGVMIHNKSIMGGYFARVAPEVFTYYQNLNFLGYVASVTDKGNYNPYYEQPTEPVVTPYPLSKQTVEDELDFFGIKYVILRKNEKYTQTINEILSPTILRTVAQDNRHWLYERKIDWNKDFSAIDFSQKVEPYFLGRGLGIASDSYLMVDGKAIVFIKPTQLKNKKISIKASADNNSIIKVYLNHHYQGTLELNQEKNSADFELGEIEENQVISIMLEIENQAVSDPKVRLYEISVE